MRSRLGVIFAALTAVALLAATACTGGAASSGTEGRQQNTSGGQSVSGSFNLLTGFMTDARRDHALVVLNDGRVMSIAGKGKGATQRTPILQTAEIRDAADTWTRTPDLAERREVFTGHGLDDGRVIVFGGADNRHEPLRSTEIWDPATNAWTAGPDMAQNRWKHASVKLNDGRIMVIGGIDLRLFTEAEIFDPAANTFTQTAKMSEGRA
ncbi:MAG: hypothetical protein FJ317_08330, partial [SAR202 cluster bacterium]|nr:hypothetical protein [SAR202 cluster bacterium]